MKFSKEEIVTRMRVSLVVGLENSTRIKTEFIKLLEGYRLDAYYDRTGLSVSKKQKKGEGDGCITVGVGFNMCRSNARDEWEAVGLDSVLFDQVYRGEANLTAEQVDMLLDYSLSIRRKELRALFSNWDCLPQTAQTALESVYYNCPRILRTAEMARHIGQGDWCAAGAELINFRMPIPMKGLIIRRRLECIMICGSDSEDKRVLMYA